MSLLIFCFLAVLLPKNVIKCGVTEIMLLYWYKKEEKVYMGG